MVALESNAVAVIEQVFAAANIEAVQTLFATDVRAYSWELPGEEVIGFSNVVTAFFQPAEAAFADSEYDIKHLNAADNLVIVDAIFSARFVGSYHGVQPHGNRISWAMRDLFQIESGRITIMSFASDTLQVARQLGVIDKALHLFPQ